MLDGFRRAEGGTSAVSREDTVVIGRHYHKVEVEMLILENWDPDIFSERNAQHINVHGKTKAF